MPDNGSNSPKARERFGRYLILDHLVDGGMAQICRARFLGEQADKVVAIKMVQPQYSSDESFKSMFMDEIKTTFGLLHPNIVQTYDYGLHKGQLFVAMEYCDGRNLKEYLDKLKERKFVFPVEISTYIVTLVCQGLHYAHTFIDKLTGLEANIIHRDISPHNIMLTYDGSVKIIDFGIAKSQSNSESTQAGTIKGKLSYLAPEYLEGLELDSRYDQFAVGITLWEMLCSRKLFKANNDLAVLKKIQECKIPAPSSVNPNVPKELDDIVLKALSKDRNKRYEDLDQLNRALIKFLYTYYPDFNATDLSYFAKELFKQEIKEDREKLFEYGKIDLKPYLEDLRREQTGGIADDSEKQVKPREREQVIDFGFEEDKDIVSESKIRVSQMRNAKASGGSTKIINVDPNKKEESRPKTVTVAREKTVDRPQQMTKTNRAQKTASGTKTKAKKATSTGTSTKHLKLNKNRAQDDGAKKKTIIAASVALLVGFAYFQFGEIIDKMLEPSAPKVVEVIREAESDGIRIPASSGEKGTFRLTNFDKYRQKVYLDGIEVEPDVVGTLRAPLDTEVTLRVQQSGRRHFITTIRVTKDRDNIVDIPNMPQAQFGFLETSRVCIRGILHFEVYGEKRKEVLPIPQRGRIAFPVDRGQDETTYEVFFQRAGEDIQRKFTVNFKEGRSTDFCDFIN